MLLLWGGEWGEEGALEGVVDVVVVSGTGGDVEWRLLQWVAVGAEGVGGGSWD